MKKVMNKVTALLLCFLFVIGVVLVNNYTNVDRISYSNYKTVNPDSLNEKVFVKLDKLYGYAEEFAKTNPGSEPAELTMQYIRLYTYNNMYWNALLDPMSILKPSVPSVYKTFATYVKTKDSTLIFNNSDDLIDETTHRSLDFDHLMVALLTYYKYDVIGPTTSMGQAFDTNYAGWAGDLVTVLEQVIVYRQANSTATDDDIRNYVNRLIATNTDSTLNAEDSLANMDAINIYSMMKNGTKLVPALRNYYKNNSGTGNNSANRLNTFKNVLNKTEDGLEAYTKTLLSLEPAKLGNMMNNASNSAFVQAKDIAVIADEFAAYVYGKVFVELEQESGSAKIGETLKVNMIEKNVNEHGIFKYDKNVVNVVVRNSVMYVEAVSSGTTKVEVYNGEQLLDTYEVTVIASAPAITKDLIIDFELVKGLKNTISFTATGANVYTWYIADTEDGEYTKFAETKESSLQFIPTADQNGKYIKCGIKSDGYDEIFTKAAKLVVVDTGVVNTSDTSLLVAGFLVVLAVVVNVVFIIKKRKVKA